MITEETRDFYKKFNPNVTDEEIVLAETMASMIAPCTYHPDFLNLLESAKPLHINGDHFEWEVGK